MTHKHSPLVQSAADHILLDRWKKIPVAVAVDLLPPQYQIDPLIHPLLPPGQHGLPPSSDPVVMLV